MKFDESLLMLLCMRFLGQARVKVAYIPEVMINMRLGGASNRSLGNIMRKMGEDYRALHPNGVGGLWALVWKNLSKLPQFVEKQRDVI